MKAFSIFMGSDVLDAISPPYLGRILSAELRRMVREGAWPVAGKSRAL